MTQRRETVEEAFLATYRALLAVASRQMDDTEAEDLVHDAYLGVRTLAVPPANPRALLRQYLNWRMFDRLRTKQEALIVLESDLPETEEGGEMRPTELSDLEALSSTQGGPPAWPTAVDPTTPEQCVMASELRDLVRERVVSECGTPAFSMFLLTMDGLPQAKVAALFKVDQSTVSRAVAQVQQVLRTLNTEGAI